jgi:hypothetical protein
MLDQQRPESQPNETTNNPESVPAHFKLEWASGVKVHSATADEEKITLPYNLPADPISLNEIKEALILLSERKGDQLDQSMLAYCAERGYLHFVTPHAYEATENQVRELKKEGELLDERNRLVEVARSELKDTQAQLAVLAEKELPGKWWQVLRSGKLSEAEQDRKSELIETQEQQLKALEEATALATKSEDAGKESVTLRESLRQLVDIPQGYIKISTEGTKALTSAISTEHRIGDTEVQIEGLNSEATSTQAAIETEESYFRSWRSGSWVSRESTRERRQENLDKLREKKAQIEGDIASKEQQISDWRIHDSDPSALRPVESAQSIDQTEDSSEPLLDIQFPEQTSEPTDERDDAASLLGLSPDAASMLGLTATDREEEPSEVAGSPESEEPLLDIPIEKDAPDTEEEPLAETEPLLPGLVTDDGELNSQDLPGPTDDVTEEQEALESAREFLARASSMDSAEIRTESTTLIAALVESGELAEARTVINGVHSRFQYNTGALASAVEPYALALAERSSIDADRFFDDYARQLVDSSNDYYNPLLAKCIDAAFERGDHQSASVLMSGQSQNMDRAALRDYVERLVSEQFEQGDLAETRKYIDKYAYLFQYSPNRLAAAAEPYVLALAERSPVDADRFFDEYAERLVSNSNDHYNPLLAKTIDAALERGDHQSASVLMKGQSQNMDRAALLEYVERLVSEQCEQGDLAETRKYLDKYADFFQYSPNRLAAMAEPFWRRQ